MEKKKKINTKFNLWSNDLSDNLQKKKIVLKKKILLYKPMKTKTSLHDRCGHIGSICDTAW